MTNITRFLAAIAMAATVTSCAATTESAMSTAGALTAGPAAGETAASDGDQCSQVIDEARATGDPLSEGSPLFQKHLVACHELVNAPAPEAAPTTTQQPPPVPVPYQATDRESTLDLITYWPQETGV